MLQYYNNWKYSFYFRSILDRNTYAAAAAFFTVNTCSANVIDIKWLLVVIQFMFYLDLCCSFIHSWSLKREKKNGVCDWHLSLELKFGADGQNAQLCDLKIENLLNLMCTNWFEEKEKEEEKNSNSMIVNSKSAHTIPVPTRMRSLVFAVKCWHARSPLPPIDFD